MDHAVSGGGSAAQTVEIFERTAMNIDSRFRERRGSRIRAGEAKYFVACGDQFFHNGGPDESCRSGYKDTHGNPS
jgi:hypothetical protein